MNNWLKWQNRIKALIAVCFGIFLSSVYFTWAGADALQYTVKYMTREDKIATNATTLNQCTTTNGKHEFVTHNDFSTILRCMNDFATSQENQTLLGHVIFVFQERSVLLALPSDIQQDPKTISQFKGWETHLGTFSNNRVNDWANLHTQPFNYWVKVLRKKALEQDRVDQGTILQKDLLLMVDHSKELPDFVAYLNGDPESRKATLFADYIKSVQSNALNTSKP